MAIKQVKTYQAGWRKGAHGVESEGYGWIRLSFEQGGYANFSVGKADWEGLVDLLRNEKPLTWDESAGFLYSGSEPIGEGES
ncbi:MAG: hypothetical protein R3A51_13990 [Nannocystaceae bacterium]|nr:hypothetical protein [Myxococcales bacterium]